MATDPLGDLVGEQGNYIQAEKYFEQGLTIARQIVNIEWESNLLTNLGLMTRKQGNYVQAETNLQEGLSLARQLGIPQMIANALYEYGNVYLDQLKLQKSEDIFQQMLKVIPEGSHDLVALAQFGLARIAAVRGNKEEALRLGTLVTEALEEIRHRKAFEVIDWVNSIRVLS